MFGQVEWREVRNRLDKLVDGSIGQPLRMKRHLDQSRVPTKSIGHPVFRVKNSRYNPHKTTNATDSPVRRGGKMSISFNGSEKTPSGSRLFLSENLVADVTATYTAQSEARRNH